MPPMAAAAMAATSTRLKLLTSTLPYSGASMTPASAVTVLERIHAIALTRSELTPASCRQSGALHHGPHPEPDRCVAEQQPDHDGQADGHGDGEDLVPVDVVLAQAVDVVGVGRDARRPKLLLGPEEEVHDRRDADQQADGGDQLDRHRRGADVAEQQPVEDDAEQRPGDHDRGQQRQPPRPVVLLDRDVEDDRRHVGLGAEGQIEDAGGLIGDDQPDGDQREHAAVGQARDGVGE